jgi:hypothetical protein
MGAPHDAQVVATWGRTTATCGGAVAAAQGSSRDSRHRVAGAGRLRSTVGWGAAGWGADRLDPASASRAMGAYRNVGETSSINNAPALRSRSARASPQM